MDCGSKGIHRHARTGCAWLKDHPLVGTGFERLVERHQNAVVRNVCRPLFAGSWQGYCERMVSGESLGEQRYPKPAYGCIVVFERQGGGHVGFVVGQDKQGNLMVLGGNQGDAVNIKPFAKSRVIAYLWPNKGGKPAYPAEERYTLPLLASDGKLSRNEA